MLAAVSCSAAPALAAAAVVTIASTAAGVGTGGYNVIFSLKMFVLGERVFDLLQPPHPHRAAAQTPTRTELDHCVHVLRADVVLRAWFGPI